MFVLAMRVSSVCDLSIMSWNVLAPCWVKQEWYPYQFEAASDHGKRFSTIVSHLTNLPHDIIILQEVQENMYTRLKESFDEMYTFDFAPNSPTTCSAANGLLTLIRKDSSNTSDVHVINGILDDNEGEAIQIIAIPAKNIYVANLHLHWMHRVSQAKMVLNRCNELLGTTQSMTILAGDLNAEIEETRLFDWNNLVNVFQGERRNFTIPTYYPDTVLREDGRGLDHIFYDPQKFTLIRYQKAWNVRNGSLADTLATFGSDHIYVRAEFNFI